MEKSIYMKASPKKNVSKKPGKKSPVKSPVNLTTYDHLKIEKKWQKEWVEKKTYKTETVSKKKKEYVLDMFPYPSGVGLHVGHPRGYIGSDVYARMKRMSGYNVLHPMGFDSFGLPAEQYAIQTKKHPGPFTEKLVEQYKKQLEIIGFSYDWDRAVATHRPEYYKWTQSIFLKIYDSWYDTKKDKARTISELVSVLETKGNASVNAFTNGDIKLFSAKEWKAFSKLEQQNVLMQYRLAYEGYAEVNWCAELGTVLANDEIVDSPKGPVSERGGFPVIKKQMRQWFMRISAYAERMLRDLDLVDYPAKVKTRQTNWIGKSEGAEINFPVPGQPEHPIKIFTTRPDTIYGATFIAISAGLAKEWLAMGWKPDQKVQTYIAKTITEEEKADFKEKEKTGIYTGFEVMNPASKEMIPVWITNYVLKDIGTGAIMAVPAHDERDFAFAQKYDLPIKDVVLPTLVDKVNPHEKGKPIVTRSVAHAIVYDPKQKKYLIIRNKKFGWDTVVIGGIEGNESPTETAVRELREETGYIDLQFKRILGGQTKALYYTKHKGENRIALATAVYFELGSNERVPIGNDEDSANEIVWIEEKDFVPGKMVNSELAIWLSRLTQKNGAPYIGEGGLINSGKFDGLSSVEAKKQITEFVGGKMVTKYKMRDAIFARQRYWGEPIPLRHDKTGVIIPLKEKDLPLLLPNVKSYEPTGTGESPLAGVKAWTKEGYETNTMPGWAASSWYFLRYMDPGNKKEFASKKAIEYWKQVDMYVGGDEHATGHVLYARFWHKFLYDMNLVPTKEPFKTWRVQGMIGGTDGRKMSKRWGNVINPDDVVKTYGADTLRVYESFMGPFDASLPWSTESIIGSRRFIERVWKLGQKIIGELNQTQKNNSYLSLLHKTIKKVTDDIAVFGFNTAVSSMMICLNEMEKAEHISKNDFKMFLQLLAPFAPHMTDELWYQFGEKKSIHISHWPTYNPKLLIEEVVMIAVQINGKVRAEMSVEKNASNLEIEAQAVSLPRIKEWIDGKEIKRIIVIPSKIVNIVI